MTFYFTKEIDNEILSKKMDKTTFEKNRNKYIHSSLQIDINNKISKFTGASSCTNPKKKTLKYDISTVVNGRSKFVEQVEYNGIDTSNVKNEFTYLINGQVYELFEDGHEINIYDNFKKYLKAIKFESTSGFYLRNNDNFNNKTTDVDVDYIKYKGIYFKSILDDEDFVKIYNADSNELIHTFTKENIDNYNSIDKAFIYPEKIKKIIIETNKPTAEIGSIISIDTKELVKLEEKEDYLKNKTYIIQNIKTSIQKIKDSEYTDVKNGRIIVGLKEAHSLTSGKMTKPLSTYKVNKNSKQQINVSYSSTYPLLPPPSSSNFIRKEVILIKYPKEIKNIKINSIINNEKDYQYNDLSGKILGYEQYEKDGYQYIKVYTTSDKIERATNIFIDADIQVDPTIESKRLYATIYNYNNLINKYYTSTKDVEDINLNKDKEEEVGISRMEIDIITPDSLVISQELSDYNNKNDHVYGPNTGFIENNGTGKATVNIYLTNRWSPAASNIKILGRIPYEGNKTPISKESLKSTFNTTLRGPIEIPDELEEKVRIYYSEVESNNTIDINDNTYNWIEYTNENKNQINWSKVKSFFVDLGNNKINAGKTVKFKYDVNIPQSKTTNEKSYATAAALFDLETKQDGNIKSSAESDRVGVIFLKRYNLNISALIKGNKNPIAKSIYKIENYEEDDDKIVKIGETDSQGRAVVKDLRVNERYKLTEETIDSDYVVNKQPVDFILKELDNGNLELEIQKDGNIVETSVIQPTETENATVNINMEYLQKYSLKINKMDKESRTPVKGATYILKPTTDNGESNISGSTNENGEVIFKGLIPKVNYTLEEKSSPQYYLNPKVKYEVSEVNGAYSLNITEGEVESKELVHNNTGLNNAKITLLGEKIKTYSININKYEKGKNKKLSKAQFKVVGDGYENGKTIETNDEGIAKLEGLYEYREDKDYTAEYTVTEIIAPDGYKKSEGTLKFKVQRNSNNEMELKVLEDTLTKKNKSDTNGNKGIRIENSIVNIDIENELFFKLIKKDGKTEEGLPNTKFAIYKVNEDGTDSIALDIKGNKVGILERDTNIPNGEGYVVTTNESGEISIALPEGKYKFIEIQAPDYKYDLPSAESERTYYFTVKNNRNSTYKLLENKNIKKVLKESYGPGEGEIDSTYVNGKTVHYKLDKEGEKYHLRFYNNEFDIIKDLELNRQIDDLAIYAIGNNGIIYTVSGQKIVKFSDDGSYIGEYPISRTGMNFRSYGILRKSTMFGNRIFANNKVLIRQWGNGAIYDIDTGTELNRLLGNIKIRFDWWIDKPSYNGGIIELDFSRASNEKSESINIYDDNLKLIKNFPVKAYKFEPNFYPNSRNNLEELHEDIEGNIYVNTYINESEDRSEISVYDREGNLQRTIQKPLEYFKVLPDGKIYFYGFDGTKNKVILTDNNGNKLAEKELEGNNVKLDTLKINADGSIEYSDNKEGLVTHKLDLIEEESTEEQQSELVVTNNWKKFKITTSAGEHGSISGAGETPYEEVEIYSNATKEITITPEEGYRIKKVTINGATVPITLNSDNKTMTIAKFENMTENKDIKAEFSNQGVTIRTNYYIKDTTTPVSQSEVQTVDMGESYTTAPKTLAKYELEKNERGEYVIPTNASGTVPVVTNPADKRDIEVTYYYTKKKAKVITKYLLDKGDGNTEEIKTPNEQTLEIDTQYTTSSDVGNPKYELIRVDGNSTGTIENTDDITVTYIYRVKRTKVIVKYLDVTESETGTPLPSNDGGTVEDVEINGQVDDRYRTTEANNVQPNYSLVSTPENDSGTMTIAPTTVVYKYRKVAPTINNINVTKVGPNKIASKTQLNTYNITFNVNLSNYIGSGSVKLTDKLPYGIHHEASDELASGLALDGGVYNDETKEIVWNISISDINSYKQSIERNENNTTITQDGTSVNVTINKTISIRYKDLPNYNQGEEPKIENSIFGKIILDRNNEREVNSKSNSPASYNTAITVKKKWNDNSNSAEKRPTSITFALYKTINGQETKVKDYTLTGSTTTDDGWETKIEQLPLYDGRAQNRDTGITNAGELGNIITYRIEEISSNKFYQRATTKPTENEYILTNTFTVPNDKIEVQVNKVWEDNSNANGKRPTSIKYVLTGNGLTKEQTVTGNTSTNEDWSYKFTDLPKYNAQGNEIVYTVAEQEATTDGLKFYSNEISGEYKTGITIKNKFTVPENKIEVPVTKTWLDDNNSRSKRPTSIKYVLKGGATETEQVVTGNSTTDENWNYTFTNLPKYNNQGNVINYSIEEQEVTTNDLKFYTKAVNGFNVTNTFKVPEDKVTPRVTITWEDSSNVNGKRPNNVKLVVKDNEGKKVKEAIVTGNPTDEEWNKVFENVPKYDKNGNPIPYTVEEQPNTPDGLKFYKVKISGDIDQGFKVTNKFEVPDEKIELTVNKTWADDNNANNKRPTSIKYVLTGNGLTKEQVVTGSTTTDDNWSYKFTDLPKYNAQGNEIVYTVDEQEVNSGDFKFYTKQVTGLNVTNTFTVPNDKIEVQVNKVWKDNSNANGKRPASIKYVLSGDTLTKEQTVTGNTTSNEDWSYKFTDLPKYNAQGNEIVYTVAEQEATAEGLKFYSNEITGEYKTGITITNTFTIPENKVNVKATKTWIDSSNAKGKRPSSIKYILKGGATPIEKVVSGNNTTDENWSYTFENLAKYDSNGQEYQYSVEEEITENAHLYTKVITGSKESGFNVINTFKVPEDKLTIAVTKEWNDNSNVAGKRPSSIKYILKGGATPIEEVVSGNNTTNADWNHTFTNVAKYNDSGDEITYTLEEQEVSANDFKFYKKAISGDYKSGFNVVNTFEVPDEKVEVQVNKVWEDENNANTKRPTSIKYVLKGGATPVDHVVSGNTSSNADWSYKFTN
ncbi:MAG: Cna B-type domain-containing protein, partial [Clostridiales bacterium]|nr:Cna B-type domain-containing protein [Clostridiales bacterium]